MPRAVAARAVPSKRAVLSKAVKGVVSRLRGSGNIAPDNTPALYGVDRFMVEQLEDRVMLTVIPGATPPAGNGQITAQNAANTFDYQDQFGQHVRVYVQGNIKVELVGSDVNGATNNITLNQVPGLLTTTNSATGVTTQTQILGGFGSALGSLPVTGLNLNTNPPSVNFNPPGATTNITDIGSQQDPLFPQNPGARVGGDDGLGNLGIPQGGNAAVNFDAIAANGAGQTFGFNVTSVPVGQTTRIIVQLVQFNNQNGNATVVEDLNRSNFPGAIDPVTGNFVANDANRFGSYLFPAPTGSPPTQGPQVAPTIEVADFLPTDDTKLYFVATVPTVVSGAGGTATTIQAPRLFIYDFTKALGHRITAVPGDFNSGATASVINGLSFDPNNNHLWVYGTFPGANNTTRTGLVDMGANVTNSNNLGLATPVVFAGAPGTPVEDIEFLGSGPGDINNDPGGVYILTDTNLFRADITQTIQVAGVANFAAENFGALLSFPASNPGLHGGTAVKDLAYNPAILNPFFLAEDPSSTRRGVFLGTDTSTDELLFIDFRNRHPSTDVFTIYATKNDPNGSSTDGKIAISVDTTNITDAALTQNLTPYSGGVTLHVINRNGQAAGINMGPGGVLIGALSNSIGTNPSPFDINFGGVAYGAAAVPPNTFSLLPSTTTALAPGLITAPGISLDSFLLGGTITGGVNIADSIQTFYAGAVVTGDASGGGGAQSNFVGGVNTFPRSNNFLTKGNFSVGGDLRELVVGGNISSPVTNVVTDYSSGTDFRIGGRLGEVHTGGSNGATGLIVGSDIGPVLPTNIIQREVEFEGETAVLRNNINGIDFAQFKLSPADGLAMISNSAQPQYLGTINSSVIGPTQTSASNVVQVRGIFQNTPNTYTEQDTVDNYGVGLLAGQTYTFQIRSLSPIDAGDGLPDIPVLPSDETSLAQIDLSKLAYSVLPSGITLTLIDPDGRVVATDTNDVDPTQTAERPFSYKADRPGVYTLQVTAGLIVTAYEVLAYGLGKYAVGGYRADGSITDARTNQSLVVTGATTVATATFNLPVNTPGLEVQQGDFGVLDAGGNLLSEFNNLLTVDNGNMRVVIGGDIGTFLGTPRGAIVFGGDGTAIGNGIDVFAPHGALGLVHNFDPTSSSVVMFNSDAVGNAFGGDIQLVDSLGVFLGNLLTNKAIGVIRVGDLAVASESSIVETSGGLLAGPSVFAANFDHVGTDGTIDLIETHGDARNAAGDFGTLAIGGPAITTGPGGNVRYIRSSGNVYRDLFFGGGAPDFTTSSPGEPLSLTDDSGSVVTFTPTGPKNANLNFNPLLPEDPVLNPRLLDQPTITALTYPIRGSGGSVIVDVTCTQGLTITTSARGSAGTAEISYLTIGTDPTPALGLATAGAVQAINGLGQNVLISTVAQGNPTSFTAAGTTTVVTGGNGTTALATATADTVTLGTLNSPLNLIVKGATTDIFDLGPDLVGTNQTDGIVQNFPLYNIDTITNNTGGELVNMDVNSLGTITNSGPIGLPKAHTGEVPRPFEQLAGPAFPTQVYPFQGGAGKAETIGVYIATNVVAIRSRRGIGNIAVGSFTGHSNLITDVQGVPIPLNGAIDTSAVGNIGELTPDFGGGNNAATFDGIDAPIIASGTIVTANIGEGILPTGSGSDAQSGLYAYGPIDLVQNSRSHADIRGTVASATRIGEIKLNNGSIINANINVFTNLIMSSDLTPLLRSTPGEPVVLNNKNQVFSLGSINISGDGGIIGAEVEANSMGPITTSGFGIFDSLFIVNGDGEVTGLQAGGYGIRNVTINAGTSLGYLKATANGSNLPTNKVSSDVRLSEQSRTTDELSTPDPFFLTEPNRLTDIHANLSTSSRTPTIKGITNTGIIESVLALGSRDLGTVSAYQIRGGQPFATVPPAFQTITTDQATTLNFGESIGTIKTGSLINGLSVTTGQLKNFQPGSDVLHTSITVASKINNIHINGSLAGNSLIQTTGFNSSIGTLFIKKNLAGQIITTGRIGTINIGGNVSGSITINNTNRKSKAVDSIFLNGNVVTGSLTINGDVGTFTVAGTLGKVGDMITIHGNLGTFKVATQRRSINGGLLAGLTVTGSVNSISVNGRIGGAIHVGGHLNSLTLVGGHAPQSRNIVTGNIEVGQNLGNVHISNGSVGSPSIHAQSIGTFVLNLGNLQAGAAIRSDSSIKSVSVTKGNIFGSVNAVGNLNSVSTDGDLGNGTAPLTVHGSVVGKVQVGGSVFSGVTISGDREINHVIIGGNFESGAVIQTPVLGQLKIGGAKRGKVLP